MPDTRSDVLRSRFNKCSVFTINELSKAVGVTGRTICRDLKAIGYLSSFSHAGKHYTLLSVPVFNAYGLWFYRDIGFSKHGTLRATIVVLIRESPSGYTHEEFQAILRLKVHNTLHDLVRDRLIGRVQLDAVFLYVALDANVSRQQVERRKTVLPMPPPSTDDRTLDLASVVEILLIVIHKRQASVSQIRSILGTKSVIVSDREVGEVLERYGLKKKEKRSHSRRSKK